MGNWANKLLGMACVIPSKAEKINCTVLSKPCSILFNTLFKAVHTFILSMQINKSSVYMVTMQGNLSLGKKPLNDLDYLFIYSLFAIAPMQLLSSAQGKKKKKKAELSAGLSALQQWGKHKMRF